MYIFLYLQFPWPLLILDFVAVYLFATSSESEAKSLIDIYNLDRRITFYGENH